MCQPTPIQMISSSAKTFDQINNISGQSTAGSGRLPTSNHLIQPGRAGVPIQATKAIQPDFVHRANADPLGDQLPAFISRLGPSKLPSPDTTRAERGRRSML